MDIEGVELAVMPEWMNHNLLKNVKNVVMEYHGINEKNLKQYLDIMEGMDKLGFKIVGFDPTWLTGVTDNHTPFGELFWRKIDLPC